MRILRKRSTINNNEVEQIYIIYDDDTKCSESVIYEKQKDIKISVCNALSNSLRSDKIASHKPYIFPDIIYGICSPIEIRSSILDSWPYMYNTEFQRISDQHRIMPIDCITFRDPNLDNYYIPVKKDYAPVEHNYVGFDTVEQRRVISQKTEEFALKYGFNKPEEVRI